MDAITQPEIIHTRPSPCSPRILITRSLNRSHAASWQLLNQNLLKRWIGCLSDYLIYLAHSRTFIQPHSLGTTDQTRRMRLNFVVALLLATCIGCFSHLAHCEQTTVETNSIRTALRGEEIRQGRKLADDTAADEERALEIVSKLKNLVKKSTQSVKIFQRNPTVVKEVESLKNSAVISQSLQSAKQNPTMMKQFNTLNQHPEFLKSLQSAPAAQSVKRVQTFLTKGQTRGTDSDGPGFIVSFLLIWTGVIGTLLLANYFTQN
ncbi:hypothetical protein V7S43_017426 [Phytophthora oleae]|uniref:RxLR effector protein n=1 Tax=Phytophthora oleae TaxID=2107226 RepID=A0ABD3ET28_9STRA